MTSNRSFQIRLKLDYFEVAPIRVSTILKIRLTTTSNIQKFDVCRKLFPKFKLIILDDVEEASFGDVYKYDRFKLQFWEANPSWVILGIAMAEAISHSFRKYAISKMTVLIIESSKRVVEESWEAY